jgi:hypothetical protein
MSSKAESAHPDTDERPVCRLRGLVTEADMSQAEQEWPGLSGFLDRIPAHQRPATFLDLVWRFECWRESFGVTLRFAH